MYFRCWREVQRSASNVCLDFCKALFSDRKYRLIVRELTEYMGFYVNAVDKKNEDEKCYSDDEYSEFIRQASENRRFLGLIHIFALSNILRRPILLYSNEVDMSRWGVHENGIAGLFLPTRQGPYRVTGPPIAIAWSDEAHDHFVPLVQLDPTSTLPFNPVMLMHCSWFWVAVIESSLS